MWPTYRRREIWLLLALAASLLVGLGVEWATRRHPDWVERVESLESAKPEAIKPEAAKRQARDRPPSPVPVLRLPTPRTPLDMNRASAVELERLPGVGPVLAERIVRYREEYGPFRDPADLRKVGGIGPKKFDAMRELVTAQ